MPFLWVFGVPKACQCAKSVPSLCQIFAAPAAQAANKKSPAPAERPTRGQCIHRGKIPNARSSAATAVKNGTAKREPIAVMMFIRQLLPRRRAQQTRLGLQAAFLSQRYDLEDKALRHLPHAIRCAEKEIVACEADAALVAQTAPASAEHFSPMVIHDETYTTTKDAGSALLEACAAVTTSELVPIGTYRGFEMEVSFDRQEKEYRLTLRGQDYYPVPLGVDVRGNITRIDNALGNLAGSLQSEHQALADLQQQLAAAKEQMGVPFPQEAELVEKSARLAEVNAALNLDQRENEDLSDDVPDEGDGPAGPQKKKSVPER